MSKGSRISKRSLKRLKELEKKLDIDAILNLRRKFNIIKLEDLTHKKSIAYKEEALRLLDKPTPKVAHTRGRNLVRYTDPKVVSGTKKETP